MASAMVERPSSGHSKLHKRNPLDTPRLPRKSPTMPSPVVGRPSLEFKRKIMYEEPHSPSGSSLKLKPYVRRPSWKEEGHVDLSRSIAENETLAGLGLGPGEAGYSNTYTLGTGSVSDVSFTPVRGQRHRRSTSGNSHISTQSNGLRQQPSTYVHPLRQAPRPYTPPASKSYTSTVASGSSQDDTIEEIPRPTDSAEALRQLTNTASIEPPSRGSESLSQFPSLDGPPPLQIRTSDLSERFASPSQTSLPGLRSRGTTIQSIDTVSPSSRPSLDKALHFIRGQRSAGASSAADNNTTTTELIEHDASRAASIRAARRAYQEREDAKDRKAEMDELRSAERELKKQHRQEERRRRKSEAVEWQGPRPQEHPRGLHVEHGGEKDGGVGAGEYGTVQHGGGGGGGAGGITSGAARGDGGRGLGRQGTSGSSRSKMKKRGPKSTWAIFLAWFRTRLLRMGR